MFDIFRQIYFNSIFYDKKISKFYNKSLEYKPSAYLLTSILKFQTKKLNIDDFSLNNVWINQELDKKHLNRLSNFFWLFSVDLKSSSTSVQSVIKNWIEVNFKYNSKNWNFDTTSKRIISWLSNYRLTYENSNEQYKIDFNKIIHKQTSHLINQIDNIHSYDLVNCFWEFYKKPKKGVVYNIGGGRYSNCSILEAISEIEQISKIKIKNLEKRSFGVE